MNNERLQILKMVQEGKVSPEEAAKLLEAVEQPDAKRPKPKVVRLMIMEGSKAGQLVLNIGMVQWLFKLPGTMIQLGAYDKDAILEAISRGTPGKVLEAAEGNKRFEIWLD
ncbi:MAG: hypothetical protein K0R39_1590 [Symbiobacteriaceae bacterium]|jgi:hypothetical protein|nr:hypothetical protein [Symbiobacteriaceae bacterium]